MAKGITVVAGASGHLGGLIARSLRRRGARARAIVRPGAAQGTTVELRQAGVDVVEADYGDPVAMRKACEGASCVVSALSGLRDVL
ncbi:MAG: NAD(P)H-binding protein, partial [Gemmatimonadaceae bacterium]